VPWSPRVALSPALTQGDPAWPLVYVTLGSSGDVDALPAVLAGLEGLPLRGVLSTAGRRPPGEVPANFRVAEYVPGDVLARQAAFVVTNGGSATGYQALAAGAPVLGIPSNLDQYLTMQAIARAGAGVLLRSGGLTAAQVRAAAIRLLDAPGVKARAEELARSFATHDCHQHFQDWLTTVPGRDEKGER
jgi:UDP:flavonoid glycosyltransferase YjiC (YdhE family)